jgi:hypothetical protein
MGAEDVFLRVEIALCAAFLMLGAIMALTSANLVKRIAGLLIANIAAVLAAAVLTGGALLIVGVAVMAAALVIGSALIVRLQERYGGVEAAEQDAADSDSEPRESDAP